MKYLLLFLLAIQTSFAQVFFSSHCEKEIIRLIKNSKKSINVSVYSISNDNIMQALIEAKKRGIKLTILTDATQTSNPKTFPRLEELIKAKPRFKVHSVCRIMHDKVAIFDNKEAITGSYNWTNPASTQNSENCITTQNKADISKYQNRFKKLWKINSQEYSDCFLRNINVKLNVRPDDIVKKEDCKIYKSEEKCPVK